MAKKKKDLTPYQQARRQFVQQRVERRGVEGTPEQRAQFRQRFDVLAGTKEGRGKIARQLNVEDPKAFRRMLATEMRARSNLPTTGDTRIKGSTYKVPNAKEVTAGWQQAVKSGSYKVPTPATKTPIVSPPVTKTSSKSSGNIFTNRRSNIIGKGIDYPGRAAFERILNPLGQSGPIKDLSAKGIAKAVGGEIAEGLIAYPQAGAIAGTLKAGAAVSRFGLKTLARFMPRLGDASINKFGGVGKKPYGPQAPAGGSKPMLELGPGPAPAPSSVSSTASAGKSTAAPRAARIRINAKGGVGGKPYGPQAPASSTPAPATKTVTKTKTQTKTAAKKSDPDATKPARPEAEDDAAYALAQMKNRFPGMTEKDIPFIKSLNRAQQAIEKKSSGYEGYAKWLKNPQTVATLRRLRSK